MALGTTSLLRMRRKRGRCDAPAPRARCGSSSKAGRRPALGPGTKACRTAGKTSRGAKAEVMAALTEGDDRAGAASRECSGAAEAGYWRDLFEERAAHREFDGGHSRADAERLAFGEMILEWHRRYGARPDPFRCAGCGDDMPSRCCEFVDSRLRRSPPDRASAVPYGQAGENAMRFPHLAHRSAAAHKLHSTPQQDRMNWGEYQRLRK